MASNCTVRETLVALNVTATACDAPVRDRSREFANISNILGVISALFVVQRFAYKLWAKVELGLDDWVTLLALVSGVPNTVLNATGIVQNGMGRDVWTLQPSTITNFNYYFFIQEIIYFLEVAMLKLSLLFFYARIFTSRTVQRMLWTTVGVCVVFGITFALVSVFQCAPVHYFWTMWDGEHHGKCLDINAIAWSNASISIALDIWMLAVPLWQLGILNLDWRKKAGVGVMFCVGTL
ncbi:hypothetical protein ESCO_002255 [Escovopsis weberi]|uniref:Rhodopsin domain-containing protein n=1 Tax=Escovopsis weberi TaxID=150374 RepID=A0A0M8N2C4_ESCWE|nr:hypothetical protein ESCO_002255 [Escovopsis weberi]